MVFQNDIVAGASGAGGGYTIDQSIRFNDNDSPSLRRTPSATSSRTTATVSVWFKWNPDRFMNILTWGTSGSNYGFLRLGDNGSYGYGYTLGDATGGSFNWLKRGTILFRDPSAWYHYVAAFDTTDATAEDRVKLYINGTRITNFASFNTNPSLNYSNQFNLISTPMDVGRDPYNVTYADGYMAEYHWIDGQALAPTDFGEYNTDGVWVPIEYTGTYGTNGFYITGADSANLGTDYSGNGNDFTSSGLTTSDQVPDSPTDNYCTLNPLTGVNSGSSTVTHADGNLQGTNTANYVATFGTLAANSGKYYFEYSYAADANYSDGRLLGGVVCVETADHNHFRIDGSSFIYPDKVTEGNYMIFHRSGQGTQTNTGTSPSAYNTSLSSASATGGPEGGPDIYMVAMDLDNNNIYWGKNGTWYGASSTSGSDYTDATPIGILAAHQGKYFSPGFGYTGAASGTTGVLNCGQDATFGGRYSSPAGDFYYTPPTGFSKLSTSNLATPTITDGSAYFQTSLYTGNASTQEINQSGNSVFQPSWVWIKERNTARSHTAYDEIRGATKYLQPNEIDAESTNASSLTSFDADGFTVGSAPFVNNSGSTYVGWQWLAANGTASNNDGTITSTVSANTTAGFSIVSWTATGTGSDTIGHGLGVQPAMVIKKEIAVADSWFVQNINYTSGAYSQFLEGSQAETSGAPYWNSTFPTSSVFSQGTVMNSGNASIAYCFAEVDGFSKFGKYTGNGSANGPFIYCGFRPAFLMFKRIDAADNWAMYDTARDTYNYANKYLYADLANAEATFSTGIDILSNGFKWRMLVNFGNASGGKYIFMAFAEHPFGGNGVAPVPAR